MLKQKLVEAPILQSPHWLKPFKIMCDASDYAAGAVLGQRVDKKPVVIFYASKTGNGYSRTGQKESQKQTKPSTEWKR
ncbi:DNA-directed DNA polymerase [Tanacetum coccineum]